MNYWLRGIRVAVKEGADNFLVSSFASAVLIALVWYLDGVEYRFFHTNHLNILLAICVLGLPILILRFTYTGIRDSWKMYRALTETPNQQVNRRIERLVFRVRELEFRAGIHKHPRRDKPWLLSGEEDDDPIDVAAWR